MSAKADIKNKPLEDRISFLNENVCSISVKERRGNQQGFVMWILEIHLLPETSFSIARSYC